MSSRKQSVAHVAGQFVLIEKVRAAPLFAEEQPVPARGAHDAPLFDERAKRREAGAGADHDELTREIGRHREMFLLVLEIHRRGGIDRPPVGEPRGGHALALASADRISHRHHEQVHLAGMGAQARRDGIQPRDALAERFDAAPPA